MTLRGGEAGGTALLTVTARAWRDKVSPRGLGTIGGGAISEVANRGGLAWDYEAGREVLVRAPSARPLAATVLFLELDAAPDLGAPGRLRVEAEVEAKTFEVSFEAEATGSRFDAAELYEHYFPEGDRGENCNRDALEFDFGELTQNDAVFGHACYDLGGTHAPICFQPSGSAPYDLGSPVVSSFSDGQPVDSDTPVCSEEISNLGNIDFSPCVKNDGALDPDQNPFDFINPSSAPTNPCSRAAYEAVARVVVGTVSAVLVSDSSAVSAGDFVEFGEAVRFSAVPAAGYYVSGWLDAECDARSRSQVDPKRPGPVECELEAVGDLEPRAIFSRIPAVLPPDAPEDFRAVLVSLGTRTTVGLSWQTPALYGGDVTAYFFWRESAAPSPGTTDCGGVSFGDFSASPLTGAGVENLSQGDVSARDDVSESGFGFCHKYGIAAENSAGRGPVASATVYAQGLPDAPGRPAVSLVMSGAATDPISVAVSWAPATVFRGAIVSGHEVLRARPGGATVVISGATPLGASATTFADGDPPRGARLRYFARSRSGAGLVLSESSEVIETPEGRLADPEVAVPPAARDRLFAAAAGYFGPGYDIPVADEYELIDEDFSGLDYDFVGEAISIRSDNAVPAGGTLVLAVTARALCAGCSPSAGELTVTARFAAVAIPRQPTLKATMDADFVYDGVAPPAEFGSGGTVTILADDSGGFGLDGSGRLVRVATLTLAVGDYAISLGFSHAGFLGVATAEVRARILPDCAGENRLTGSEELQCGSCADSFGEVNGFCIPSAGRLDENARTCEDVFSGDWVDLSAEHGEGKGVCSEIDINDTFCLAGTVSALPCLGLFDHVRDCNLLGRPALDPWHCGAACDEDEWASDARCVSRSGDS